MGISSLAVGKRCWCEISVWNTTVCRAVKTVSLQVSQVLEAQYCIRAVKLPWHRGSPELTLSSSGGLGGQHGTSPGVPGLALVPLHGSATCHRGVTFVLEQGALESTLMLVCVNACSGVYWRFVVTAEQMLFSQQPHCLTLPNGQVSPLSPEMPWYWKKY